MVWKIFRLDPITKEYVRLGKKSFEDYTKAHEYATKTYGEIGAWTIRKSKALLRR